MTLTAEPAPARDSVEEPTAAKIAVLPAQADPWHSAPFARSVADEVRALVARLAPAQRLWLSGYLAGGLTAAAETPVPVVAPDTAPVTILFGSQSGNSQILARRLSQQFAGRQTAHRVLDMLDCRKADLEQARELVVIVSTHGDGDPPERAAPFFELLFGRKAPQLTRSRFAVMALGDTSYEHYCAAGRRVDARLEELGARRAMPRIDCDVDFEAAAAGWIDSIVLAFAGNAATMVHPLAEPVSAPIARVWTRKNPFAAEILANQPLTARGSTKDVRHVELSLDGADLSYQPGDALGVAPRNAEAQVEALVAQLEFAADTPVQAGERELPLGTALCEHFEIGTLTAAFVRRYAQAAHSPQLRQLADNATALQRYLYGRDLRDLVAEHPPRGLDARTFAALLPPLAPRLYSIASSPRATPDEVHLTIGVVAHESRGRARRGVVSGRVAMLDADATLPVYLHRNDGFRLPADPAAAIIMIGAGTGVAPYRGFLADREASGAPGRNWLVFGDRSFELDFLYQAEWLAWRRRGLLTRLDVAFSRDQAEKIYVQHRLREHGADVWRWLQEGAHLYLCGDATQMAPDVEGALLDLAREHGDLDAEAAREYLLELQRQRRYQKDVY